jgi:hypothetical protein
MELNKIKQHLELALRPAEKPTLEEVLEQVSTRGVLRGPVDWAFPAWMLYVEYASQEIIKTFQLTEEEKRQLLHSRETLTRLLMETWIQTKEKLTTLYKAVVEGTYKVEGNKLYAPDRTWMRIAKVFAPQIPIRSVTAKTCFPDLLKLGEKLVLLQLGWRASDEGRAKIRPYIGTTQPWQVFAWATTRYGELYARITWVVLTREGVSVSMHITARSWSQRWSKEEAIDLVASHLRRGEWAPLLTAWLGDGKAELGEVLRGEYKIIITAKEPWRLGISIGTGKALVATGKEAFVKLREAAGVYGMLLDVLRPHKWIVIKLATDYGFRSAYKLKTRKRSIDILRETYRRNDIETSAEQLSHIERNNRRKGTIVVAGIVMHLGLMSNRAGSLIAEYFTRDVGKALAVAERLESAGLRPNVVRSNSIYVVYITTTDLLRLAEEDNEIKKAIALYLTEKAKNGTPRQREVAEKILKRHPSFSLPTLTVSSKSTSLCINHSA